MFEIEKGIPVHPARNRTKYPFAAMEVGDSFFVPDGTVETVGAAASYAQRRLGFRFTVRTIKGANDNGVRVWRVA